MTSRDNSNNDAQKPDYLERSEHGSGQHKHPASTRLDDDDFDWIKSLHPKPSVALRMIVKRYKAICDDCRGLHTNSFDSTVDAG